MNVIITGATGMVGKGVLLECLESDDVASVLSISRRPNGLRHAKMREVILSDVSDLEGIDADLSQADACFFGLGVSSFRMSEADYRAISYDLTLKFANTLVAKNPAMTFCYVSGAGTNAASKTMWARVKGETENALMALPFKAAVMFRPGLIEPMEGVQPTSKMARRFLKVFGFIFPLMRAIAPNTVTTTSAIGRAFINVSINGSGPNVLGPAEINRLGL
ncbi:MAG: epimerase [Alphaproteobacteria bacterium]|nr:epimerase [Alphaproteobacteria bacterium]